MFRTVETCLGPETRRRWCMSAKKKANNYGRADLVEKLKSKYGLSRRQATEIVNIVLERMIAALQRGGEVEFPLGKLKLQRHRHRKQEGQFPGQEADDLRAALHGGARSGCEGRQAAQPAAETQASTTCLAAQTRALECKAGPGPDPKAVEEQPKPVQPPGRR